RLDVAVTDSLFVRRLQSAANLSRNAERNAWRETVIGRFRKQLRECVAAYALHADEVHAFRFAVVVRAQHVAMSDLPREPDLAFESLQLFGRAGHHIAWQRLDRHLFVELCVGGLVNDSHSSAAEDLLDAVSVGEEGGR